jgi:hypothetical protein
VIESSLKRAFFSQIGYEPHPAQEVFHNSTARFRIPLCGRRFGKSLMAARDRMPTLFVPHTMGWICGPSYSLGEKEFRVFWDDLIIGKKMGRDPKVRKAYSVATGNMYIELPNRSRVEVKSSDHANSLVGEGLDWLILSEAAKHVDGVWEKYLRPALSDRNGGADFVTTPEGQNWLYKLWQVGQDPANHPGSTDPRATYESWNFPTWANTVIFPGGRNDPEILAAEAGLRDKPGVFRQEYGAEPTSFAGKIFEDFNEATHVAKVEFNPNWPSYVAFDWGWNTFAAIEFQMSPQDELFVWREYYDAGKTLDEHIRLMQAREQPDGYHLDIGFGDGADPSAAAKMSQDFVFTWAEPDAKKNWREGVDELASYMVEVETGREIDEYGTPEKRPRFFVDHSCKRFIHELSNYRTPKNPSTGADVPDKPFKKDDHGVDALRYGVMHIKLGFATTMDDFVRVNRHLVETAPAPMPEQVTTGLSAFEGIYATSGGDTIFNFENVGAF